MNMETHKKEFVRNQKKKLSVHMAELYQKDQTKLKKEEKQMLYL